MKQYLPNLMLRPGSVQVVRNPLISHLTRRAPGALAVAPGSGEASVGLLLPQGPTLPCASHCALPCPRLPRKPHSDFGPGSGEPSFTPPRPTQPAPRSHLTDCRVPSTCSHTLAHTPTLPFLMARGSAWGFTATSSCSVLTPNSKQFKSPALFRVWTQA